MDSLSLLFNAMWQDAQRPRRRNARPNTVAEIAAYSRRSHYVPRLIYSAAAGCWFARDRVAVSTDLQSTDNGQTSPHIHVVPGMTP